MRFLEKELQSSSTVEARDAISRLIEAQVKERMLANVTPDYSFRVVDKAIPADRDDPVKPQKALLIAVGVLLGLVVGLLPVLVGGVRFAVMPGYRKD
jgi:LPS O-antigen subunit length determinant protein (WzzB/FepE family)